MYQLGDKFEHIEPYRGYAIMHNYKISHGVLRTGVMRNGTRIGYHSSPEMAKTWIDEQHRMRRRAFNRSMAAFLMIVAIVAFFAHGFGLFHV